MDTVQLLRGHQAPGIRTTTVRPQERHGLVPTGMVPERVRGDQPPTVPNSGETFPHTSTPLRRPDDPAETADLRRSSGPSPLIHRLEQEEDSHIRTNEQKQQPAEHLHLGFRATAVRPRPPWHTCRRAVPASDQRPLRPSGSERETPRSNGTNKHVYTGIAFRPPLRRGIPHSDLEQDQ